MSIQEAYRAYRSGNFQVNRRYQRKLVWTVEEKQALIDSVLSGYPIPLILLAYEAQPDGSKRFEILDGMQRLNALFSYVENRFSWRGRMFDVNQLSRAKQLADEGVFEACTDAEKLLDPSLCANFLDYTLAVSEFPSVDEAAVNDIFGRINSSGRQLSSQEKRQAGVVSSFATVVREMSAEIRGDVSRETLDLAVMPAISIDVAGESPENAIKADETFWCKQGILRRGMLRDSEDEQLLADLSISVLMGEPQGFSGKLLDQHYDPDSEESSKVDVALKAYGATLLKHHIVGTLSVIKGSLEEFDDSANAMRRIVHPKAGSNPIKTAFYAVFMAFFDLCVKQRKTPGPPTDVWGALRNLQAHLEISAGAIRAEQRRRNVSITKGLVQDHFVDAEPPALEHGHGVAIELENALRRSRIETAAFECKQGLLSLGPNRDVSDGLLDRIVETLCGIANIGPDADGGLFIGVCDNEADKRRVEQLDGIQAAQIASRFVVGVDREAAIQGIGLEGYIQQIATHIKNSGLSEPLKSDVLSKLDCATYRGLSVVCLWVPGQTQASSVNDAVFVREGPSTLKVNGLAQTRAVLGRFDES
ncbi:MAG TPA: DUF262 domain-containing protein [Polyangiaceae bacterium LLY-WYZ-15_(1-7)]|nr:DUF262 domain-containing protein [Polyangiaceae bacterium LLY-WYZ-15_(1-7)]HJL03558.1 DUF262 domain-containing protein [Polyangiaceae bacterium LLY-WYZ-15_(1-7)]HJL09400.1 DUF262 domain-containing protein [Polyangiaceae bacterium LLY-WYZ-15_(1-7)]HJL21587.1 DUF262 domain-containing protein [Polyangiaceae bacterium LLY-WYZ-15_(1-7)]HJL30993.1 DUF262 domain-containing protein [Polyangiaceae bacterium LLY-WYZ-15_(1-7)]